MKQSNLSVLQKNQRAAYHKKNCITKHKQFQINHTRKPTEKKNLIKKMEIKILTGLTGVNSGENLKQKKRKIKVRRVNFF